MKNETLTKDDNIKFSIKSDTKIDNRARDEIFEVAKDGVSIEWTANVSEAMAVHRQSNGSKLYSINMHTGNKSLRHV